MVNERDNNKAERFFSSSNSAWKKIGQEKSLYSAVKLGRNYYTVTEMIQIEIVPEYLIL